MQIVKVQNWCQSCPEYNEYIRSEYLFGYSFVSNLDTNIFGYSFVSKEFIQIYSDIHSCHFLDTNIFGHSFVSKSIRMSHSDLHQKKDMQANIKQDQRHCLKIQDRSNFKLCIWERQEGRLLSNCIVIGETSVLTRGALTENDKQFSPTKYNICL